MENNKFYCKIDGVDYNLKDAMDIYNNDKSPDVISKFSKEITKITNLNQMKGWKLYNLIKESNGKLPTEVQLSELVVEKTKTQDRKLLVTCPYCNSSNVKKVGIGGRLASTLTLGIASNKIGKQWHCNNCKSNF